jgi:hypothetical protein
LTKYFKSKFRSAFTTFCRDVGAGFFVMAHSTLALIGLALFLTLSVAVVRPDFLTSAETQVYIWIRENSLGLWWEPENTADRSTAIDLKEIPRRQSAVATWLAKKYKVAPEPIAALVAEAYVLSETSGIKPHLILAVMAIESNFHPYIQSPVGAQGLMQVMTDIHIKKYEKYGGKLTAFDPLTNMRVGVAILQECINLRQGSIEGGLLFYMGGTNADSESGYVAKVLAEQQRLDQVAAGDGVSMLQ